MPIYGRKVTVKGSVQELGAGTGDPDIVASTYGPITANGWVERYGAWLGKASGGAQNIVVGHYLSNIDRVPTALQGHTTFSVNAFLTEGTSGANFESEPDTAYIELDNNGIPLFSGSYPAIFVYNLDQGTVSYEANDEFLYSRDGLVAIPSPFGETYIVEEVGQLDAYIVWRTNNKPGIANLTPNNGANIADITPVFVADFNDVDEPYGDRLTQYHIQVRKASNKVIYWDAVFQADSTEQSSGHIARNYAGTTLTDSDYQFRMRICDYHFAWSDFTNWRDFSITSGPKVETPTAPTGKQETQTPGPFLAVYNHTDGRSYNQARIEIWNASNGSRTTLRASATLTMSGGDNTTISIPWQAAWSPLEWSRQYIVRIQARDNQNKLSPWSDEKIFNINAAPTIPTNLSPNDTLARGSRPLLSAVASDADDTVATGLGVDFRIKGPALLSNTNLDTNNTGWSVTHQDAGIVATKVTNVGVIQMNVTGTATVAGARRGIIELAENIPVIAGETYRLTADRQSSNGGSLRPKLAIIWYQANGTTKSAVKPFDLEVYPVGYDALTNTWETKVLSAIAPSDAAFARIGIAGEGVSATWTVLTILGDNFIWDTGNIRYIRAATLRVGTVDIWDYQVVAADADAFGIFKYDARSKDGSYTSPWSSEATFSYQAVPTIDVTVPTEDQIIFTSSLQITWTTTNPTGQSAFRLWIYDALTDVLVYETPLITQSELLHSIPLGYLHHGESYYVIVESTPPSGLISTSPPRSFSVSYTLPESVTGLIANPYAVAGDTEASAILLSWDVSNIPPAEFSQYVIYRVGLAGNDLEEIILRRLDAVSQNTFLDMFPASGVPYVYSIRQAKLIGVDVVESLPTTVNARVDLTHPIISGAAFGSESRVSLRYMQDNSIDHISDFETVLPWGETEPTIYVGPADYHIFSGTFQLINDRFGTAKAGLDILRTLDAEKTVSCYRDHRSRKFFGFIELSEKDAPVGMYVVDLSLTESNFREGEE